MGGVGAVLDDRFLVASGVWGSAFLPVNRAHGFHLPAQLLTEPRTGGREEGATGRQASLSAFAQVPSRASAVSR